MKKIAVLFFIAVAVVMPLRNTMAASDGGTWLLPDCVESGKCNTCHMLELLVNWGQGSVGMLSIFAVFMFVFGGFWWLISTGNQERINRGKQIMIGAAIGLILSLMSYILVTFTIAALSGKSVQDVKIFDKEWNEFSCPDV